MAYTKTVWANEVPASSPVKYEIIDDVEGEIAGSATIELVTSVTAGTPVNATNLNHLEDGLEAAAAIADSAQADADQAETDAIAAQSTADAALLLGQHLSMVGGSTTNSSIAESLTASYVVYGTRTLVLPYACTVLVWAQITVDPGANTPTVGIQIVVDGTVVHTMLQTLDSGSIFPMILFAVKTGVAAGSRVVSAQVRRTAGSGGDITSYSFSALAFRE